MKQYNVFKDIDGRHVLVSNSEIDEKFQEIIKNVYGISFSSIREFVIQMKALYPIGKLDFSPEAIKEFFSTRIIK